MNQIIANIRLLTWDDFNAVVHIDAAVLGRSRTDYYEMKFSRLLNAKSQLITSLVAVVDGDVVGFIMGELYVGEYGIPATEATLDTIGVHPGYQGKGIARQLIQEFTTHLKKVGVQKLNSLVAWNDRTLIRFFSKCGFTPSPTINLELHLMP
jgi:ribosomal protein S18 acetylase RimI-like enzyme